jgi:hypothetical protein
MLPTVQQRREDQTYCSTVTTVHTVLCNGKFRKNTLIGSHPCLEIGCCPNDDPVNESVSLPFKGN